MFPILTCSKTVFRVNYELHRLQAFGIQYSGEFLDLRGSGMDQSVSAGENRQHLIDKSKP